jgi:hypothetical protein
LNTAAISSSRNNKIIININNNSSSTNPTTTAEILDCYLLAAGEIKRWMPFHIMMNGEAWMYRLGPTHEK